MNTDTPPQPARKRQFIQAPRMDEPQGILMSVADYERSLDCIALLAPHPDLSAVEIHSKETMDEVRKLLTWYKNLVINLQTYCEKEIDLQPIESALAKLNPPQG